jgi:uncharacterized protein YbcI
MSFRKERQKESLEKEFLGLKPNKINLKIIKSKLILKTNKVFPKEN